jgi:hypothetical protein
MPVNSLDPNPKIKIIAKGMLFTCINESYPIAEIVFLKDAPNHNAEVKVVQKSVAGDFMLPLGLAHDKTFQLYVTNPVHGIQVFNARDNDPEPFHRATDKGNPQDFRWVVDLEGPEFFNRNLTPHIKKTKLSTSFYFNSGVCFTHLKSDDPFNKVVNHQATPFGKTVHEAGVNISFNAKTKAVLLNEGKVKYEFLYNDGFTYEIHIDRSCDDGANDFPLIYTALTGLKAQEKIYIESNNPGTGGDVPCMGGNFSRSPTLKP